MSASTHHHLAAFALLACSVTAVLDAFAMEGPPPVLNPKDYTSRSSDYTLRVVPSDKYGAGSGSIVTQVAGDRTLAWRVDMNAGSVEAIEGFGCPVIKHIAGYPDGGFIALTTTRSLYGMTSALQAFDAAGRPAWTVAQSYDKNPEHLFSPQDIAVTSAGDVGVCDVIRKTIQVFDRQGAYIKTLSLNDTMDDPPGYPAHIAADGAGSWILRDNPGPGCVIRIDADGKLRSRFQPSYADGRVFSAASIQAAPDGRLWACDGQRVLRLTSDGVVDLVVGAQPDPANLGQISEIRIDWRGQVYVLDRRTAVVHVFDPAGNWVRTCAPNPDDFQKPPLWPRLTVDQCGELYVHDYPTLTPSGRCLRYSATGERVDPIDLPSEILGMRWYAHADPDRLWAIGYDRVCVLDRAFKVVKPIERGADGQWLQQMSSACVAPDGSVAVAAHTCDSPYSSATVNVFDASGNPTRTFALPGTPGNYASASVAFDGRHLIAGGQGELIQVNLSDGSLTRLVIKEGADNVSWVPFISASGAELLLFDANRPTNAVLRRFAMP